MGQFPAEGRISCGAEGGILALPQVWAGLDLCPNSEARNPPIFEKNPRRGCGLRVAASSGAGLAVADAEATAGGMTSGSANAGTLLVRSEATAGYAGPGLTA